MKRLARKFGGGKKDKAPEAAHETARETAPKPVHVPGPRQGKSRKPANSAGIHRPGNGYDPQGEAEYAAFVGKWAHQDDSFIEEIQARVDREKQQPRDPYVDEMTARMLDAQYAAEAYVVSIPEPPKTADDMLADLMARMDGEGLSELQSIPSEKLATIPWPFGNECTYPGDRICQICAAARLERAMICDKADRTLSAFRLSETKAKATVPGCPMCRLLLSTFRGAEEVANPRYGDQTMILARWDSFTHLSRCSVNNREVAVQTLGGSRRLYTELIHASKFKSKEKDSYEGNGEKKYGIQLIYDPREDPRPHSYYGKGRIIKPTANIPILRAWVDMCIIEHEETCPHPDTLTSFHQGFRVIDVKQRCLVEAPEECQYVALSYVWGSAKQLLNEQSTQVRLRRPGGLADSYGDIPLTIRDAILLVENMGFEYIWIDALCIEQDNNEDKRVQIRNMDAVYSRSLLTIVAACGNDCNYGLPGVRPNSRAFQQVTETVGGILLCPIADQLRSCIASSTWETRGWTLQEKLLSRRILIVSDTQIFWKCAKGTLYEDVILEAKNAQSSVSDENNWPFLDVEENPIFDRYRNLAKSFVHRRFTDEIDGLNAVMGINKKLAPFLAGKFHRGLPEKFFDACMLWDWPGLYNPNRLPRLYYFPSWSWVSLYVPDSAKSLGCTQWGGVTTIDEYRDSCIRMRRGGFIKICSLVDYYKYTQDGNPVKIDSEIVDGNADPDFIPYLTAVGEDGPLRPMMPIDTYSAEKGYAPFTPENPRISINKECDLFLSNVVGFYARLASFFVEAPKPNGGPIQEFKVALDEGFTDIVGKVTLDCEWRASQSKKLDFVAAARHVSHGPHVGLRRTEGWFFHLLLIEQMFDLRQQDALGGHAGMIHRKVAVMFDVDCDQFDKAKPALGCFLLT